MKCAANQKMAHVFTCGVMLSAQECNSKVIGCTKYGMRKYSRRLNKIIDVLALFFGEPSKHDDKPREFWFLLELPGGNDSDVVFMYSFFHVTPDPRSINSFATCFLLFRTKLATYSMPLNVYLVKNICR